MVAITFGTDACAVNKGVNTLRRRRTSLNFHWRYVALERSHGAPPSPTTAAPYSELGQGSSARTWVPAGEEVATTQR